MKPTMRIMSARPLNAETPIEYLRSWITPNRVFFDRNQGAIPRRRIALDRWRLQVEGEVENPRAFRFAEIERLPRAVAADTLECSGNGRALLSEKAAGNPWSVGGVGNAVWGGVWLREILDRVGLKPAARHVVFEGFDRPLGAAGIPFVRSIPLDKALHSTLLAYEMNGEPLPLKHGYPLRALALGWTGANCVKWLSRITVRDRPHAGFYMDQVYRIFQKGEEPHSGEVVTAIRLKAIITRPRDGERLPAGPVVVLGAAYAGEEEIGRVEVSVDGGARWEPAELIGPQAPYAWRQWQFLWKAQAPGAHRILARATDARGRRQPERAVWNVLGYGNNGVAEHGITVAIA